MTTDNLKNSKDWRCNNEKKIGVFQASLILQNAINLSIATPYVPENDLA